jgi:hypothetical protein|tara:strand:- start:1727 stop:2020 length:294 start_codon:yes stop_codon:yes gene_type:complete
MLYVRRPFSIIKPFHSNIYNKKYIKSVTFLNQNSNRKFPRKVILMSYNDNKVDKALNFLGMYSSFEEVKNNLSLNEKEYNELKARAKQRYGKEVFSN